MPLTKVNSPEANQYVKMCRNRPIIERILYTVYLFLKKYIHITETLIPTDSSNCTFWIAVASFLPIMFSVRLQTVIIKCKRTVEDVNFNFTEPKVVNWNSLFHLTNSPKQNKTSIKLHIWTAGTKECLAIFLKKWLKQLGVIIKIVAHFFSVDPLID